MQMNRRLNIRRYCSPVLSSFSLTCMLIGGFIVLLSLSSCNEYSEPETNSFYVQCYIDSIGQITTIEGIMSKSNLGEPRIHVKDNRVLSIERKGDGLHYVIPQHVGFTKISVNTNDKEYNIIIRVQSEGCEGWEIREVVSQIICSYDVKESVLDDLSRRNIFSEIQKGDKLHFGTDPRNVTIWREKYYGNTDEEKLQYLEFSYEQDSPHYFFKERVNDNRELRMSFILTKKEFYHGDFYNKEGFFRYDPTLVYQKIYGKDKVKQVVIDYKVKNIYYP